MRFYQRLKSQIELLSRHSLYDYFYFAFLVIMPFVYSHETVDPVLAPRQIFLGLFILIICVFILIDIFNHKRQFDLRLFKSLLFYAIFIFVLSGVLSWTKSVALSESIYVFSRYIVEIIFLIITTFLIVNKRLSCKILAWAVFCFLVIIVVYAASQLFDSVSRLGLYNIDINSITSLSANKNLLSSLLLMSIGFLFFFDDSIVWKLVMFFLSGVVFLLIIILQSKAVIISSALFFFTILLYYLIAIREKKKVFSRFYPVLLTSFLFLLSILFAVVLIKGNINDKTKPNNGEVKSVSAKFNFSRLSNTHSTSVRLMLWDNSLQMIEDNLILGVGQGNWQIVFPKYGLEKFDDKLSQNGLKTYQRPHNDFLWIFCEQGIFGGIFYILIFIIVLYYGLSIVRRSPNQTDKFKYFAITSIVPSYMLISFVDFPMERIEHQVILCLIFSVIISKYYWLKNQDSIREFSPKMGVYVFAGFLVLSGLSAYVAFMRVDSENHILKLYVAHKQGDWETMITEAESANNFCCKLDPTSVPLDWYSGVASFSLGDIGDAKNKFAKSFKIHPYNIHVLNNLASCYESVGNHDKAELYYLKALQIFPGFEESIINLSAVYFNSGRLDEALEMIGRCNVTTGNVKYRPFLKAILRSSVENQVNSCTNDQDMKMLNDLLESDEKILKIYFDSKKKHSSFVEYIYIF